MTPEQEITHLKAIIHKRNAWLLRFHEITNHNRIGKNYITLEEQQEINRINREIAADLLSDDWDV